MPHDLDLILTLTGGLAAALVFGFVSQKLRLSPIVGYLLAGVAVGPFTPGFVAHGGIAEQFAEVGVILLMFGVGLHFHVRELLAVRRIAIPGAVFQIAIATALGVGLTMAFGWELAHGIVFGLAISVASTVVLLRVLADNDALHTPSGHIAVGWLIVEDLFTVLVLVLLPIVAGQTARTPVEIATAVGFAALKVVALVVFTLFVGQRAIPAFLERVSKERSRELFTLTVLVVALGLAVGAAKLFGVSMALGAFLAGMVVGQSEFSTRAASEALPMRDAFAVLFFVSMGMLVNPSALAANWELVLGTVAVILVGKPIAAIAVVLALRHPAQTATAVAVALAQIGEFSFILAAVAREHGLLPEQATQILVASAIVSITVNPLLFRWAQPLARLLPSAEGGTLSAGADPSPGAPPQAIVVGYGPVGRTVVRLLRENGVEPVILELNLDTVKELRGSGASVIYGDASQQQVLEAAGIMRAESLVFASSGSPDAVVRQANALRPGLLILTRTMYVREAKALRDAGADVVVVAEAEVGLAMTEHLLRHLGATADQLDRARDRVRNEIGGAALPDATPG